MLRNVVVGARAVRCKGGVKMKQIYITSTTDNLGFISVNIYDCETGLLRQLWASPEEIKRIIDALRAAGEDVKVFETAENEDA